jgi:hypothetical protein
LIVFQNLSRGLNFDGEGQQQVEATPPALDLLDAPVGSKEGTAIEAKKGP